MSEEENVKFQICISLRPFKMEPEDMEVCDSPSNKLQILVLNLHDLKLPTTSWGAHVDDNNLVLLSVKVSHLIKCVNTRKSVVISEGKGQSVQVDTFLSQIPIKVPYLDYNIKDISDLQSFLNQFEKVQFCKYFSKSKYEGCETIGKHFSDICANCEAAHVINLDSQSNNENYNSNEFKCNKCSETCATLEAMKCHAYVFHNKYLSYTVNPKVTEEKATSSVESKEDRCKICGEKLKSLGALREHELIHFNSSLRCAACHENFNCVERLIAHTKKYHPNIPFIGCQYCGKRFAAARLLRVHLRSHVPQQQHACSKCELKFHTQLQLEIHEKLHKSTVLQCGMCKKQFVQKQELYIHYINEHAKKFFSCHICQEMFDKNIYLIKHMQLHKIKIFKCNLCPNQYKTYNELIDHKSAHRSVKRYICPNCRQRFQTRGAVDKHTCKAIKFKCEVCDREFDKVISFKMHRRGHYMRKLFNCAICKRNFSTKGNLAAHQLWHNKQEELEGDKSPEI